MQQSEEFQPPTHSPTLACVNPGMASKICDLRLSLKSRSYVGGSPIEACQLMTVRTMNSDASLEQPGRRRRAQLDRRRSNLKGLDVGVCGTATHHACTLHSLCVSLRLKIVAMFHNTCFALRLSVTIYLNASVQFMNAANIIHHFTIRDGVTTHLP